MGPEIVIPVVLIVVIAPIALVWARRTFRDNALGDLDELGGAPGDRLTSDALRTLDSPPWRVVPEIAPEKLGGVAHVLIGPPGVYAVRTSMEPLPPAPDGEPDARAIGQAAIERGELDDALRRCALDSDGMAIVHWGVNEGRPASVETLPGVVAVDGRRFDEWAGSLTGERLAGTQVDLAWQTVVTAIGRPDPLA